MVKAIPEGYQSLVPAIYVADAKSAVDFYINAFGATIESTTEIQGNFLAAFLHVGDCVLMVAQAMPQMGLAPPSKDAGDSSVIQFYTEDVDGIWAKAVELGAEILNEPMDRFHGHRSGAVRDPFGHRWAIVKRIEDLTAEESQKRWETGLAQMMQPGYVRK